MIQIWNWIISSLFPKKCMLCRTVLSDFETDLCSLCCSTVEEYPYGAENPPPQGKNRLHFLDSLTAIWYYENDVRKSIHRFKFRRGFHLAPQYGRLLAQKIAETGPATFDCLTWAPISRIRYFQRGYDQCQLLARYVGRELNVKPIRTLRKIRNTPPQSGIVTDSRRKANVLGAYRVCPDAEVRGKTILLLDDVFTTGATSEECARVLLTAGAKEVHCAVIAAVRYRKK